MPDADQELLSRLVDVPDPLLPATGTPLREQSPKERRKEIVVFLVVGALSIAGAVALFRSEHELWGSAVALIGLGAVIAVFMKSRSGTCPYCGDSLFIVTENDKEPVQCTKCLEYSTIQGDLLQPMDPNTISEDAKFEVPLFKETRWPRGCVGCGAPPTRFDAATGRTMSAAHVVLARVTVYSGKVEGIPYCDRHKDAIAVVVGQDRSLRLRWSSLRMMRRYLAANTQRTAVKTRIL